MRLSPCSDAALVCFLHVRHAAIDAEVSSPLYLKASCHGCHRRVGDVELRINAGYPRPQIHELITLLSPLSQGSKRPRSRRQVQGRDCIRVDSVVAHEASISTGLTFVISLCQVIKRCWQSMPAYVPGGPPQPAVPSDALQSRATEQSRPAVATTGPPAPRSGRYPQSRTTK